MIITVFNFIKNDYYLYDRYYGYLKGTEKADFNKLLLCLKLLILSAL